MTTFKYLPSLSFRRVENILGSFTSFTNLKKIDLYQYEKEYFDFSLLPNSLTVLSIYSSRGKGLVNEIGLKRLTHLYSLRLSATLNASFIPSSLQTLEINGLTSQMDIVHTNITSLSMRQSETPLEFIPTNLRDLLLDDSELSENCENFQQNKVKSLILHNKKHLLDTKCLPNITTLYMF